MTFLLFLFGIFLALGMFLLTADLLRLPRLATQRAMLSVGRQEKKQARSVEALLMGWAIKLAPHIHMDEYKRGRLKNTLAAAGLNMTPEEYTAFAMVKTGAVLLAVIPCLLIFPMLALISEIHRHPPPRPARRFPWIVYRRGRSARTGAGSGSGRGPPR